MSTTYPWLRRALLGLTIVLAGALTYHTVTATDCTKTCASARQIVCDDGWHAASSPNDHRLEFFGTSGASALFIPARIDTGASHTIVARCVLERLEASGAAVRTNKTMVQSGLCGTTQTVPIWNVTLRFGPYLLRNMPVAEYHGNSTAALIGLDILMSTSTHISHSPSGITLDWPPPEEQQ